jgi:hypothetical protein
MQGVQRITGSEGTSGSVGSTVSEIASSIGHSGSSSTDSTASAFTGQDLGGDDLKYVFWSILFTKPGEERILQRQQEELVNYAADERSYAAVKIARYLNGSMRGDGRLDTRAAEDETESELEEARSGRSEDRVRIRPEDEKYITFLYRIDRRLAKREETTRVERVTIERERIVD